MGALLIIIGAVVGDLIVGAFNATVLFAMWTWLVMPTLEVVALSWTAAYVIVIVVAFLTGTSTPREFYGLRDVAEFILDEMAKAFGRAVGYIILAGVVALVVV